MEKIDQLQEMSFEYDIISTSEGYDVALYDKQSAARRLVMKTKKVASKILAEQFLMLAARRHRDFYPAVMA